MSSLASLQFRLRQIRFQLRLAWTRYQLATTDFATGLGGSAWVLHGLVRSLRPNVCVEIGSATGWSTCHIGLALRENFHGRLFAIDPHMPTNWNDQRATESLPILQRNLRRCGVERYVEIVRAMSDVAAREWQQPIDFLFIDGDHSYEGVKRDWELFSPHLTPFGVAAFHDTTWGLHGSNRPDMGVPRFVDELRRAGHPVLTLDRDHGVSLVQARRGGQPLLALDA
jgi:predicted O-methyltransferase YrrM